MSQKFCQMCCKQAYITSNTTDQNHRYHHAEKHNDDKGVNETEPVNPGIKNVKIIIPSSCLKTNELKGKTLARQCRIYPWRIGFL